MFVGAGIAEYVESLVKTVQEGSPHRVSVLPPVEVSQLVPECLPAVMFSATRAAPRCPHLRRLLADASSS